MKKILTLSFLFVLILSGCRGGNPDKDTSLLDAILHRPNDVTVEQEVEEVVPVSAGPTEPPPTEGFEFEPDEL
ncbi:MAG: hypothetical protein KKD31_11340 [Bacteroidetes bacterium]|nr:hypothetical protein [Bacteroidota bacterium]